MLYTNKVDKSEIEHQGAFIVNPPKIKSTPDSITLGVFDISVRAMVMGYYIDDGKLYSEYSNESWGLSKE